MSTRCMRARVERNERGDAGDRCSGQSDLWSAISSEDVFDARRAAPSVDDAMAAAMAAAPRQQLNHPNPFHFDEDGADHVEDTVREKAARVTQQCVCEEAKTALSSWREAGTDPAKDPRPTHLAKVNAILWHEGDWLLGLQEIRYALRLLNLHLNIDFIINSSQHVNSMNLQARRAVLEAVEARGIGLLVNTVRLWDVDMGMMDWTPRAARLTEDQRMRCFQVVHKFYNKDLIQREVTAGKGLSEVLLEMTSRK